LERGEILQEILKQPQYTPYSLSDEFLILYAGTHGYLDDIPIARVHEWEEQFLSFMETTSPSLRKKIEVQKDFTPELETQLEKALERFSLVWK
jgi:F-type H+-transporting ATPase subunit alpha